MSTHAMATNAARIGKLKGEILKRVEPTEVLGKYGVKKPMPKNSSDQVVFRRWLPKGGATTNANTINQWSVDPAAHVLSEGETPNAETLTPQDITVSLAEYGFIYRWTNRTEEMYEDDIPSEYKKLAGERMGNLLEMIRYGKLKSCTNIFRAGSATSRATVQAKVSLNLLRNVARGLMGNSAPRTTEILAGTDKVGTQPVESAWVVACHHHMVADLRALSGFIHVSEYGSRVQEHPNELGSLEEFRFVWSPHLAPYLAAGGTGATASTVLSNGAANSGGTEAADVYPMIVLSPGCYGDVTLRGVNSMKVAMHSADESTKDDVLGQRGSLGIRTYYAIALLNEGHMAVVEVAGGYYAN